MRRFAIDKIGGLGLLVTAVLSPCCFPLFGIGLTALGFGSFELFGGWTMYVFQLFVLVALLGLIRSYRQYHFRTPLLLAIPGTLLIFVSYHFIDQDYWVYLMYAGMLLVTIAVFLNRYKIKKKNRVQLVLHSVITCPVCNHTSKETMPVNACRYFYECPSCKTRLQPKEGDCCVFCSYGSVVCPPMQQGNDCCA